MSLKRLKTLIIPIPYCKRNFEELPECSKALLYAKQIKIIFDSALSFSMQEDAHPILPPHKKVPNAIWKACIWDL